VESMTYGVLYGGPHEPGDRRPQSPSRIGP
jgi:hypothetical protein